VEGACVACFLQTLPPVFGEIEELFSREPFLASHYPPIWQARPPQAEQLAMMQAQGQIFEPPPKFTYDGWHFERARYVVGHRYSYLSEYLRSVYLDTLREELQPGGGATLYLLTSRCTPACDEEDDGLDVEEHELWMPVREHPANRWFLDDGRRERPFNMGFLGKSLCAVHVHASRKRSSCAGWCRWRS
jgi:hypothetical protein